MESDDTVKQIVVHPAVWSNLEAWLLRHNIALVKFANASDEDLETYIMTVVDLDLSIG